MATREEVMSDPQASALLGNSGTNVWLGPSRHVIIYPADNGKIFAINGTHPARNDSAAEWNKPADIKEIQDKFHDFDPALRGILSKAQDCKSWALAEVPRLPRWVSESGKVALIGDAAHGMLQFLAQGAAMATEDAAALAECISRVRSAQDIPKAMQIYERSRKWRCEKVQANARRNGEFIHMPDGEEQEHRDRKMAGLQLSTDQEVDTGPLLDPTFASWLYGHDVFEHVSIVLSRWRVRTISADLVRRHTSYWTKPECTPPSALLPLSIHSFYLSASPKPSAFLCGTKASFDALFALKMF